MTPPVRPFAPRSTQTAQRAEVIDPAALDRLGLLIGTTLDGRLVMSPPDWATAIRSGSVRVLIVEPAHYDP